MKWIVVLVLHYSTTTTYFVFLFVSLFFCVHFFAFFPTLQLGLLDFFFLCPSSSSFFLPPAHLLHHHHHHHHHRPHHQHHHRPHHQHHHPHSSAQLNSQLSSRCPQLSSALSSAHQLTLPYWRRRDPPVFLRIPRWFAARSPFLLTCFYVDFFLTSLDM